MYYFGLRKAAVLLMGAGTLATLGGCAADTNDGMSSSEIDSAPFPRTVCFAGRTWGDVLSSGGISEIEHLCQQMPNLIRDVPGGRDAPYHFFQWDSNLAHEMDVLVAALDTNHDGQVTGADTAVALTVVGYSWGGFNAIDLVNAIATDHRFAGDRKAVAKLFALDAFRTDYLVLPRSEMDVPANVQKFYAFRHTIAPADDCSVLIPGWIGPFTGRVPYCTGSTECHDYDFSGYAAGKSVDHCSLPDAASPFVVGITNGESPANLPPEQRVGRY